MSEIVASARALPTLTDRQKRLVEAILTGESDQSDQRALWERAGYDSYVAFGNAMRSKTVQAALLEHRRALIGGDLAQKALQAINDLITSDKTPAATRFAAAKWTLEQAGHQREPGDGQDKPIHEMTAGELEAFMARAQAVVDAGGEPPIISVTPDSGA